MVASQTPIYNLKVVLKETGLTAETLRAWERRYGLPKPERTPGGQRLYSQRDIETIKWLIAQQAQGLSISHAVDLWNEQTASGLDPLAALRQNDVILTPSANLDQARKQWLDACLSFNETLASQILSQAFAAHLLETVCLEILQRGLQEIGELWYHNKISVQQEHFTSALLQRKLSTLLAAAPPPTRPQTVLLGCAPGEQHTFGPMLMSLLLRRQGLNVIYLGADVPLLRYDETLQAIEPNILVLSAQQLQTADTLRNTADKLGQAGAQAAYGGRVFNELPELRERIPAHFLGETIPEALQTIENLIIKKSQMPQIETLCKQDQQISWAFERRHDLIETQTLANASHLKLPLEFAPFAIRQLTGSLSAALALGKMDVLTAELDWLVGFSHERGILPQDLEMFLTVYVESVEQTLGQDGASISAWLRQCMNNMSESTAKR